MSDRTSIHQVGTIFVPVADQEQALDFYAGTLGFEKRADFAYGGGHRWIEVAPHGSANAIALIPPTEGGSAGGDVARCALATDDIEADHATLRVRGVDVDPEIGRAGTSRPGLVSTDLSIEDPVPAQVCFRDPDGNRFLIVQSGPDDDEQQIRTLIESWARAVHEGDIGGVLADHADDIVMFDVPPPKDGVRGIDAYAETWPPVFEWQARGASFEIVSLDVTAGDEVAYAHALLRCGTPEELASDPENRLRLTLGLRREQGRWVIAHEHHSFPDTTAAA